MFWLALPFQRPGSDRYPHEQLLRRRRAVDKAKPPRVLYAVDGGLFGLHLPRIIPHALVFQPNARHRLRAFAGQINSPNQSPRWSQRQERGRFSTVSGSIAAFPNTSSVKAARISRDDVMADARQLK